MGCGLESTSCQSSVAPTVSYAAPAFVVEYIAPAPVVSYIAPETLYAGCGDLPSACPSFNTSSKQGETAYFEVNTFDDDTGSFDLTGSGRESTSDEGTSSVGATTSSGSGDPPNAAPSGYTGVMKTLPELLLQVTQNRYRVRQWI